MRHLKIFLVLLSIMAFGAIETEAQTQYPSNDGQPFYGTKYFESFNGNIFAIWHDTDTTYFEADNPMSWYNSVRVDRMAIGNITSPGARLEVSGAIKIGAVNSTAAAGQIQWTGSDFEGYNGSSWVSFTDSGTDDQTLSTDNTAGNISIENGNTINLNVDDADADATNEIQSLSLTSNTLSLSDDGSVDLSPYLDNTDNQNITGSGFDSGTNDLTIGIENGSNQTVNLGDLDNSGTDDQTLSIDSLNRVFTISIENGNDVQFQDTYKDGDTDNTNEIQSLSLSSNTLSLSDDGNVDLSPYMDNTDSQTLSTDGTAGEVAISNGNHIVINVDDADASTSNEIQDISGSSYSNGTLTIGISDGGASENVDLSALDNSGTGTQTFSGSTLDANRQTTLSHSIGEEAVDLTLYKGTQLISDANYEVDTEGTTGSILVTVNVPYTDTTTFMYRIE